MATTDLTANPVTSAIKSTNDTIDQLCVNTIRTLAMDAVQAANSGHPGTPMALAPVVYCLWQRVLHFDPSHPIWPNRDRFVLSVGHASMLLYAALERSAGGQPQVRNTWPIVGDAGRYQELPTA
jgi:transketolase